MFSRWSVSVSSIYISQNPSFHPIIGEMSEPGLWSYVKDFKSSSVVVRRVGSNPTLVKREYSITPPNQSDSFLRLSVSFCRDSLYDRGETGCTILSHPV